MRDSWNASGASMTRHAVVTTTSAQLPAVTPPPIGCGNRSAARAPLGLRPPYHATKQLQNEFLFMFLATTVAAADSALRARISRNLIEMCSMLNAIQVFSAWITSYYVYIVRNSVRGVVTFTLWQDTDCLVFLSFLFHRYFVSDFDTGLP